MATYLDNGFLSDFIMENGNVTNHRLFQALSICLYISA